MDDLKGHIAVVTGSSRGIGKGTAIALGEKGCTVYVTGRSTGDGDRTIDTTARLVTEAEQAGYNDLSLLQLDEHQGFAMAVKAGLESVLDAGARYAWSFSTTVHSAARCLDAL